MKFSDIPLWVPLVAAILAAGMWLGRLEQRVTQLENINLFLHGNVTTLVK